MAAMRAVAFCFLLLLAPGWALAGIFRLVTVDELARDADAVVVGSSVAQESHWEGGRIVTSISLSVDEIWTSRTDVPATVQVVTLGGTVGDLAQKVEGAAVLPGGSRLVVFIKRDATGRHFPVGMWQGVYRINDDAKDPVVVHPAVPMGVMGGAKALTEPLRLSQLRQAVLEGSREH
jgi:hypothetical protein